MKTQSPRNGIILVVVLSMLSLFSVLIASYVIFSSQVAGISDVQRFDVFPINDAMESALSQIISGTTDHQSAAFGNSLLEDLYGTDGMILRVGNDRNGSGGMPATPLARGVLVMPTRNNFFKIPTSLASWHDDADPVLASERTALPSGFDPNIDDAVAGRFITFLDGPLANFTFQVLRSFGGSNVSDSTADPLGTETNMAGSIIIDLDHGPTEVEIDGVNANLVATATSNPNVLLYSLGDDDQPGRAGVNDDGDGLTDEADEAGSPNSDDIGYAFVINGTPFNGRGQNPQATSGIFRGNTAIDAGGDIELQLNARLMGSTANSSGGASPVFPEQDEPWDAADFENIFLAWQPSDHRSVSVAERTVMAAGLAASQQYTTEEQEQLGSRIIPSFHRPALINYLLNSPIRLLNGTTDGDTFWDIKSAGSGGNNAQQLIALMTRIRRATLRPLPFQHSFFGNDDLDGDGLTFDGTPEFVNVGEPNFIQAINSTDFNTNVQWVEGVARWLTNGPWDVDNDFDGIPDSVWVDFKLPIFTTNNFSTLRPMIAVLIEDLDGKVNINEAGNHRQLLTRFFPASNPTTIPAASFDTQYLAAKESLNHYGRGGGIGPAELHFGHLFDFNNTLPAPGIFTQTSAPRTWLGGTSLLWTRYGNLLNRRYGGSVFDYNTASTIVASQIHLPGAGDGAAIAATADLDSTIPFPARTNVHAINVAMGRPMDMSGISRTRRDRFGNETFDNLGTIAGVTNITNERINQPYENGLAGDTHFTPEELVSLVSSSGGAEDLGTLLDDEVRRNGALKSLLTTNSQMIDVPETPGDFGIVGLFSRRLGVLANKQLHLDRMLAPELRKGGKLNLNRALGNGQDDTVTGAILGVVDDSTETSPELVGSATTLDPQVHNRQSPEPAFPQISSTTQASYAPIVTRLAAGEAIDFDGSVDRDGDGLNESIPSGNELLARQLYCLMYVLTAGDSTGAERFPSFPYPDGFSTDTNIRNRFAARRIAQWAVNAVDFRDTDAICTRLRYDLNPLDGFDLNEATRNVVWGMERPEIEISETLAYHDKRLRRNLETNLGGLDSDGQTTDDEASGPLTATDPQPDEDMDQFRIPEAGAIVELRSLRSPNSGGSNQPSLPLELYTGGANGRLDLGRTVGSGATLSPVWRLAVGEAVQGDTAKSIVWNYDAQRMSQIIDSTSRTDHIDYLTVNAPTDWTDTTTNVDSWREATAWAAEVRPSTNTTGAYVTIADDDFDPSDDVSSDHEIQLTRFVWFANLVPDSTVLDIVTDARSGMTPANVFYNRPGVLGAPTSPAPELAPGQFAVIAPRPTTVFGQTNAAAAPTFNYSPSPQEIRLAALSAGGPGSLPGSFDSLFRVDYQDLSSNVLRPAYATEGASGATYADFTDFRVHNVLPIIAQSMMPDQVNAAATAWQTYRSATDDEDEVAIGFNISAPLSGVNYYQAPTHRIDGATDQYPLVDGYRDYTASTGLHPDQPLDYVTGAPLISNGWAGVGTHQEAVGIFLQRLADPTIPWHPVDNPYITVDLAPMDLTVMNGEGDVTEVIDREGDGASDDRADDIVTDFDGTDFTPPVRFDSRRKIPDTSQDRPATVLMTPVGGSTSLATIDRHIYSDRPGLSSSFSILRDPGTGGSNASWDYQLGALWDDTHAADDASINTTFGYDAAWAPFHPRMDLTSQGFRQTLGFCNREYGRPNNPETDNVIMAASASIVRGSPNETIFKMPNWPDRDFQSTLDLVHVPATSRTGLGRQMSPGTIMDYTTVTAPIELDDSFDHLLGFERNFGKTATDSTTPLSLPLVAPGDEQAAETGERTPFEVIFDIVSTGAESFDDRQWFAESNIKFFPDPTSGTLNARQRMFNRVVELFQPPYNHMPAYRKAGRINLNTTPDYIRKGGTFSGGGNVFLDQAEGAASTSNAGTNTLEYADLDRNQSELPTLFNNSPLTGNGSVYRSFSWAMSDPYDLDLTRNRPTLEGDENGYLKTVDSPYGHGFKAFIESRRGYEDTTGSTGSNSLRNPVLSSLYPTQFAGVFSTPMAAQSVSSVQRFMPFKESGATTAVRRRTQDMSVLRPNPDADERIQPTALATLRVESATGGSVKKAINGAVPADVTNLQMSRERYGLFERSLPELHQNYRHRARESEARFENASRVKNVTTNHSNVFLVRMTVGFFDVDPLTGEVKGEYVDPETNTTVRGRASFTVDRSVPVGFFPGQPLNQSETILSKFFAQ